MPKNNMETTPHLMLLYLTHAEKPK